jgi:chromosome segregation ATPase
MPQIFTLSGQDAIDFINKLAEQDAVDFVKALAAAAKSADVGKSNPDPTELELLSDENAALREALTSSSQKLSEMREALVASIADNQSAMRAAMAEIKRLQKDGDELRIKLATAKSELGDLTTRYGSKLAQTEAQRDAALREVESVKQHLTDSGVEGLQAEIERLEDRNDRLAESRHHFHVQLDEAKAQLARLKPFLTEAVIQLTAARNDIS